MLRGRIFASSFALLATLLMLNVGPSFAGRKAARGCAGTRTVPVDAPTRRQASRAVLCLVNRVRANSRMRSLRGSRPLRRAAASHGVDMVRRKYFSHVGLDGGTIGTRVRRMGYTRMHRVVSVNETLVWAPQGSAGTLVQALMGSPTHRDILLDRRQRHIGVGLVLGAPVTSAGTASTLVLAFGQ